MSVSTTSLPLASKQQVLLKDELGQYPISKQVANFYGLPFSPAQTSVKKIAAAKNIAAAKKIAVASASAYASASAAAATASNAYAIAAASAAELAASLSAALARPRLWDGRPSPDSLAGSSPAKSSSSSPQSSSSVKPEGERASFLSPAKSFFDARAIARLKEVQLKVKEPPKKRIRTPGSSDSDRSLLHQLPDIKSPTSDGSIATTRDGIIETTRESEAEREMRDEDFENVYEPPEEEVQTNEVPTNPDVLLPDLNGWEDPNERASLSSPDPQASPPQPPAARASYPSPALLVVLPPSPPQLTGEAARETEDVEESPIAALPLKRSAAESEDAESDPSPPNDKPAAMITEDAANPVCLTSRKDLSHITSTACPKGMGGNGLRLLSRLLTTPAAAEPDKVLIERRPTKAPRQALPVSNPVASLEQDAVENRLAELTQARDTKSSDSKTIAAPNPRPLSAFVKPTILTKKRSRIALATPSAPAYPRKADGHPLKSTDDAWKRWYFLRKPRERDSESDLSSNPLIPVWPQENGRTTTSFRRDTSPVRKPFAPERDRPILFQTVVDVDPSRIISNRRSVIDKTETAATYVPSKESKKFTARLTFDGPWNESLEEMRTLEHSYRLNWNHISAADQFKLKQLDHSLNELKSALAIAALYLDIPDEIIAVDAYYRTNVVDWIFLYGCAFDLPREVCHRAIHMVDRCLIADRSRNTQVLAHHNIMFVAGACLYQALSVYDTTSDACTIFLLALEARYEMTQFVFEKLISASSIAIFGILEWRFLLYPTSIEWVHAFLSLTIDKIKSKPTWLFPYEPEGPWLPHALLNIFVEMQKFNATVFEIRDVDAGLYVRALAEPSWYHRICHLLDLALMDTKSFNYSPSHLAASSIILTFGPRITRVISEVSSISLDALVAPLSYLGPIRATIPNKRSDLIFEVASLRSELKINRSLSQMAIGDGNDREEMCQLMVSQSPAGMAIHRSIGSLFVGKNREALKIIFLYCDFYF